MNDFPQASGRIEPTLQRRLKACATVVLVCLSVVAFVRSGPGLAEPAPKDPALRALSEVIEQVRAKYVGVVDEQKLVGDAIRGIIQGLDPYSDYLEPASYSELRQDNSGKFGGLGLEVRLDAGAVRVVSTFEDSPASRAGPMNRQVSIRSAAKDAAR